MRKDLLSWQWTNYPDNHVDGANLALHVLTVPLFMAGTVALVTAWWTAWWAAPAGLLAMVLAVAAQGRGHAREKSPPIPFQGPLDAVSRIFVEQWVTFPRYVLSGRLLRRER